MQIPSLKSLPDTYRFVLIGLVIYLIWFVVYDLWLLPDGRVDTALSVFVAEVSALLLRVFGATVFQEGRIIGLEGHRGLYVEDGCNGLSTLGLFLGFIMAYPGSNRQRAWFIPAGIGVIVVVNIVRIVLLAVVQAHFPAFFDAIHYYAVAPFYLVVFGLWVLWARIADPRTA